MVLSAGYSSAKVIDFEEILSPPVFSCKKYVFGLWSLKVCHILCSSLSWRAFRTIKEWFCFGDWLYCLFDRIQRMNMTRACWNHLYVFSSPWRILLCFKIVFHMIPRKETPSLCLSTRRVGPGIFYPLTCPDHLTSQILYLIFIKCAPSHCQKNFRLDKIR